MELVTWNNFVKKTNSTKQPNIQGVTRTIRLKENTDMLNPVFLLNEIDFSITYCKWMNRYYFVNNKVVGTNKVFELHCSLDHLATFKSNVGGSNAYIEYAQTGFNPNIVDSRISTEAKCNVATTYQSNGISLPANDLRLATYIVQVKGCKNTNGKGVSDTTEEVYNTGGVITYAMNCGAFLDFAKKFGNFNSNETYTNPSNVLDNLQKEMGSYYNSIVRCFMLPIHYGNTFSNASKYQQGHLEIYVGNYSFVLDAGYSTDAFTYMECKRVVLPIDAGNSETATFLNIQPHNDWRSKQPYTKLTLYLPHYGTVPVNIDDYIQTSYTALESIVVNTIIDYKTGDIRYEVDIPTTSNPEYATFKPHDVYTTNISADIPLVQQQLNGYNTINSAIGLGRDVMSLIANPSPQGFLSSINDAFNLYVDANTRNFTGITNSNSMIMKLSEKNQIGLTRYYHNTVVDPLSISATMGIPTQREDIIGNHSGYIQCRNASIDGNMMDSERQTVNSFLNGGFYYE